MKALVVPDGQILWDIESHRKASFGYPVLEVLELQGLGLKPVGELDGFYHHVIPERLIDFDGDGTTEIVYLSRTT